jgi:hypothetical protein
MRARFRAQVAFACAPAWLVGVAATVLVATLPGAAEAGHFGVEDLRVLLAILGVAMLLTLPALLVSAQAAFTWAPWVVRQPLVFAGLAGLLGPTAFILMGAEARGSAELLRISTPGILSAAFLFRKLVIRARVVDSEG